MEISFQICPLLFMLDESDSEFIFWDDYHQLLVCIDEKDNASNIAADECTVEDMLMT